MKTLFDAQFRRDLLKLACVIAALIGGVALMVITPGFSTPTLLAIVFTMLLSPLVAALERRGYPRTLSILIVFGTIGVATFLSAIWALQSGQIQWSSFKENAPLYFKAAVTKLRAYEASLKASYPAFQNLHPTDGLVQWGNQTGKWFVDNGASIAGELVTCLFIAPILTFMLLNDGRDLKKRFFQLVPNRYFETVFLITNQITTALSNYISAKLVEAFLVGALTSLGIWAIGAPYAIVLGIVAGVTNILPYIGPVIGAIPGLMIPLMDSSQSHLLVPIVLVYAAANIIDTVLIFPVVVAKLVNLHPLILIVVVSVGGQYYGLVGMLISIPIATAIKVILTEIYSAVYENHASSKIRNDEAYHSPLLHTE